MSHIDVLSILQQVNIHSIFGDTAELHSGRFVKTAQLPRSK